MAEENGLPKKFENEQQDPGNSDKAQIDSTQDILFFRSLMEHFSDRIFFKDQQSRIVYGSQSYLKLFGLDDLSKVVGKTDSDFFSKYHAQVAYDDEQEIIRTGIAKLNMEEMETWPDGSITWCSTSKAPLRDNQGHIIGTLGISRDITDQKATQEDLRKSEERYRLISEELADANRKLTETNLILHDLSFKDPLTMLWNRRFLVDQMPEDIALVDRTHRNLTENAIGRMRENVDILFLMVDIDHFKKVNDQYGHLAGDLVLQQMGQILRACARNSDVVARVGGEEFLVVARQMARADSHIVAERIRAFVEAHAFVINSTTTINCSCSVGFSVYPFFMAETDFFSWEQIVAMADHCLYAAKNSGRNAWVGIIPDQEILNGNRGRLSKDLFELVRSGILPVTSSLGSPVNWGHPN